MVNLNRHRVVNLTGICTIEQIIKLHEEKITLYERMLKEKDEMMDRLEKLIKGK